MVKSDLQLNLKIILNK